MYTETQQRTLVDECHQWHDELVAYREKINRLKANSIISHPAKPNTMYYWALNIFTASFTFSSSAL